MAGAGYTDAERQFWKNKVAIRQLAERLYVGHPESFGVQHARPIVTALMQELGYNAPAKPQLYGLLPGINRVCGDTYLDYTYDKDDRPGHSHSPDYFVWLDKPPFVTAAPKPVEKAKPKPVEVPQTATTYAEAMRDVAALMGICNRVGREQFLEMVEQITSAK